MGLVTYAAGTLNSEEQTNVTILHKLDITRVIFFSFGRTMHNQYTMLRLLIDGQI